MGVGTHKRKNQSQKELDVKKKESGKKSNPFNSFLVVDCGVVQSVLACWDYES